MKRFDIITEHELKTKGFFLAHRPTDLLVIHCSASPRGVNYTAKDAYRLHTSPPRSWSDIAYHFYVELDGRIRVGRDIRKIGAHVAGKNTGSIGICYAGGVENTPTRPAADTRTPAQRKSLLELTKAITRDNWDIVRIAGHNEYANKACPSFKVEDDQLGNITNFRKGRRVRTQTDTEIHEDSTPAEPRRSLVVRILRRLFGTA